MTAAVSPDQAWIAKQRPKTKDPQQFDTTAGHVATCEEVNSIVIGRARNAMQDA
jgi:hypothetical protein